MSQREFYKHIRNEPHTEHKTANLIIHKEMLNCKDVIAQG